MNDDLEKSLREAVVNCYKTNGIAQGGTTLLFSRAKNSFPVRSKGQETPPGTILVN
jgi:hypothetical protein